MRARALTLVVVLSNVAGNLALSVGIKQSALPMLALGVVLLILWTLSRITLMSWADLSYILPVTAIGYVLTAAVSQFVLGEHVTITRWSGTLLIIAGILLVARTEAKTS